MLTTDTTSILRMYLFVILAAVNLYHQETFAGPNNEQASTTNTVKAIKQVKGKKHYTNVWNRLRAGFKLSIPNNSAIKKEIKWFKKHPGYIARVLKRARPYLYLIAEEIEHRKMPSELALLPIVESAFQPTAYSHAHASGLWQFIPSTGLSFRLKQNQWYDGRRDVVASTRAALDYLYHLNKEFSGDWELSLAAYNAGSRRVSNAILRNSKKDKNTDFWSLKLPTETKNYVPKLLAISAIIKEPAKYGISLNPIKNKPYIATTEIDFKLKLDLAAKLAGISSSHMHRLNPCFNNGTTPPKGKHRLVLPLNSIETFVTKLAELNPEKKLKWSHHKPHPVMTPLPYKKSWRHTTILAKNKKRKAKEIKVASNPRRPSLWAGRDIHNLNRWKLARWANNL
ncbi:MAG: transglycosylase SLT domain-containing protein [Gammaproteobacteria bacterium]|nr:transglycosylase SLT domain-containing protein [Gammaproteobacteria bacterium]